MLLHPFVCSIFSFITINYEIFFYNSILNQDEKQGRVWHYANPFIFNKLFLQSYGAYLCMFAHTRTLPLHWLLANTKTDKSTSTQYLECVQICLRLCRNAPICCTRVRQFYYSRADSQWASYRRFWSIYSIIPGYTGSISWTQGLSRPVVSTVAQFLADNYAASCYLYRFHLPEDTCCGWRGVTQGDSEHRLFESPRFEYARKAPTAEIEQPTYGAVS